MQKPSCILVSATSVALSIQHSFGSQIFMLILKPKQQTHQLQSNSNQLVNKQGGFKHEATIEDPNKQQKQENERRTEKCSWPLMKPAVASSCSKDF